MTFSARRIWRSSSTTRTRGRSLTRAPAAARRRSSSPGPAATRPTRARRWPRRSRARWPARGPSRGGRCVGARRAIEGLEDPLALGGGDARPAVDDAHEDARPDRPRADRDRMAARVARRVLQQVGEGALELRGVGADERQVGVERERERARRAGRRRRRPRAGPPRSSTTPRAARPCAPPGATCRAGCRPAARGARPRRRCRPRARDAPRRDSDAASRARRPPSGSRSAASAGRARPSAAARS